MVLTGKTLSIAIPASYWYLKNYPIKDMQANGDCSWHTHALSLNSLNRGAGSNLE